MFITTTCIIVVGLNNSKTTSTNKNVSGVAIAIGGHTVAYNLYACSDDDDDDDDDMHFSMGDECEEESFQDLFEGAPDCWRIIKKIE